ncbi:serine/threonine-protein kinase [Chondromyces crocatus]|uniref:Protein kinase domain-containing protein n=1 Tax=Chondromyces crocatus TaxID=52 RepID=A0A0K1EGV4_CHOCO|nr:serine/threonine-protein kinase [Chondromyces crocatus]AKT40069.1 uncharacterized protein CMC5_042220 [Chondromyces crocatus]
MLSPGARIGDYEVVRHAAEGATSDVYEARHVGDGHPAALKLMLVELCLHVDVVTRFHNEAQALEQVRHARIVSLFAWGTTPEGPPYMVLEWLPKTLEGELGRAPSGLSSEVATRIAMQIAEALSVLHDRGIVHRDLKPENLLLAEHDLATADLKLTDLGLAKLLRGGVGPGSMANVTPTGMFPVSTGGDDVIGTWEYMAPEQWVRAKDVDAKADVYALGVILFRMLVGRLPFEAEQRKDWMGLHLLEPPPLDCLDGRASAPLRDLVACMLSKKAASRPTMHQVRKALAGQGAH